MIPIRLIIRLGLLPLLLRLVINSKGVQSQSVACQENWAVYGNHCYRAIPYLTKSWEDAKNDCQSYASNLVKIETADEHLWLRIFSIQSDYSWIGANDRDKEGEWRWISDNSTVTFTDWKAGEPNDVGGDEDCVIMGIHWNDDNCTKENSFICEKEGVQTQSVACQENWTVYGNHCYRAIPNLTKSWGDAQNDCQSYASNLVKIETADERLWLRIFSIQSDYSWIGANDRDKEGEWRWISDNSTVTFTDWKAGEPNDVGGDEDCVIMGIHWNDDSCTKKHPFICEKEG
ncbi:neurocan core protein-like [Mizuhopecten yessoensis]|uniref:neurocan core protein-like n=1 Tax=Mizuhopecten yessoensis TaxID=6573 RepID=UPI000B45D86F|nr:neurocan core protein-like [Mizuhopecten yessoensis]